MPKQKLTIENSGFKPNQSITISGYEYSLIRKALEDCFESLVTTKMPERYKFIDSEGEPVETPTKEDFQAGKIRRVLDVHNTFNPNNITLEYSGQITPEMVEAKRQMYEIHERECKAGNTFTFEDIEKEMSKPNLEIVKEKA